MKTVKVGAIPIHIFGSVHSIKVDVAVLRNLKPSYVFVEATRDIISLIRQNPKHSPFLLDLPSIIEFTEVDSIPIYPIDASSSVITDRVFGGMSVFDKGLIWSYIIRRMFAMPVASLLFDLSLRFNLRYFDQFINRWGSVFSVPGEVMSFHADPKYDPVSYLDLCEKTKIDKRLQSGLIEFRDEYMSDQVLRIVRTIPDDSVCVVVVGKNHVDGMSQNLQDEKISLRTNTLRTNTLRANTTKTPLMDQLLLSILIRQ